MHSFEHALYPIACPREEVTLKVSALHTLLYATYGNPTGIPVVVLHGGPGGGCTDALSRFFDLKQWNVVMFDQRGAMRSQPFVCLEENRSELLVEDMELLRKQLRIEKWVIFGGSWGSTLGLLYGQKYPERCRGFILRGIFLGREKDHLHMFYGAGKIFPEAHEPFVQYIPEEEREDLLTAYYRRIMDPNPEIHLPAARSFFRFNCLCSTHQRKPERVEKLVSNDRAVLSVAKIFFHYCMHRFFLKPNQLLSQMAPIASLPAIIVHGRWDMIALPEMAYALFQSWKNSLLWIVAEGGHAADDVAIEPALATATDTFVHHFASGGIEQRIASGFPLDKKPNFVPRS